MDDNKFWLWLWLGLSFIALILLWGLMFWDYQKDTQMAKLGYQLTPVVGNNYPVWQKADCRQFEEAK